MLISKSVYYGLRGMAYLARDNDFYSIQEIAKKEKIPTFFLEKIFQRFRKAGFVESKKGVRGGFFLIVPPRKITLKKIIKALSKETISIPCLRESKKTHCPIIKRCTTKKGWQKFYRNFDSVLENLTLGDFLE